MPMAATDAPEATATIFVEESAGSLLDGVASGEEVADSPGVGVGLGVGLGEGVGGGDGVGASGVPYPIGVYCSFNVLGYMNVM